MTLFVGPVDDALGKSSGVLATKIHMAADEKQRPLLVLLGPRTGRVIPQSSKSSWRPSKVRMPVAGAP
jgi:hypothetical protein